MITGITFCLIVTMANLVVGAFVGLTGVEGFRETFLYCKEPSGDLYHPSASDRGDGRYPF